MDSIQKARSTDLPVNRVGGWVSVTVLSVGEERQEKR